MSVEIIQDRLDGYQCKTEQEEENAIKEIAQEVCLAGLSRSGFFKKAIFQGGSCLRILYHLPRFSEDLDFILKEPNQDFDMSLYLNALREELAVYGFDFEIKSRSKADEAVKKAFLKDESWGKILIFRHYRHAKVSPKKIQIKLEVDTTPPSGSCFEDKILDFPFPFSVVVQDLPSLFAGKSHALLCREYLKGRDWYDFLWYVRKKINPNYKFLENALFQAGPWKNKKLQIDDSWYKKHMTEQIKKINFVEARQDIQRFLRSHEVPSLELWSNNFFLEQLKRVS